MDYTNTQLLTAELVRRLQERVELEQQRRLSPNSNTRKKLFPRRIAPEVEIEGMDVLLKALVKAEDNSRKSGFDSNSCNSTIYDSSDDDTSVKMKRGRRRCQYKDLRYVGRHWDPENELNMDSLRLARKTMEQKRKSPDDNSNDIVDRLSFDSVEFCDDENDSIVVMLKDAPWSSMPLR
jgi:hypothetical protein